MQHNNNDSDPDNIPTSTIIDLPPDFQPESFWLSKDSEFDWFDRNAFLSRNESINSMNSTHHNNPSSNSSSQRYNSNQVTLKSKHVIGLPQKSTCYVDCKRRPANVRLFPANKKNPSTATVPVTEPSSPKVSCIGRVRSKRCCSIKNSKSQRVTKPDRTGSVRGTKPGFVKRIKNLFRFGGHRCRRNGEPAVKDCEPVQRSRSGSRRICVSVKPVWSEPGTPREPVVGLGDMMRFASGRRVGNYGGLEDDDVAGRHSLDSGLRGV
ncbi:hypothetical protein CTI12_AA409610 [Artemisia annua]|uniref:Uncharacterized protein n=1 Tax=Artemisia annua TaxID=35608 RepID=A0A2U1M8J9_ARTAN|nr:hypothetical protein CTI12_AA409610 [Artemisia annua]